MGPTGRPETPMNNYKPTPRLTSQKSASLKLCRDGSLKPGTEFFSLNGQSLYHKLPPPLLWALNFRHRINKYPQQIPLLTHIRSTPIVTIFIKFALTFSFHPKVFLWEFSFPDLTLRMLLREDWELSRSMPLILDNLTLFSSTLVQLISTFWHL